MLKDLINRDEMSFMQFMWTLAKGFVSFLCEPPVKKFPQIPDVIRCGSFDVNIATSKELFRTQEKQYDCWISKLYVLTSKGHYIRIVFNANGDVDAWKLSEWDAKADYVTARDRRLLVADSWHPSTEI